MEPRRVLLIDNDPEFRDLLVHGLTAYGFEIHEADQGDNPLSRVGDLTPELIFIAVDLPDRIGFRLCNKAKKGVAKAIPVVLTTRSIPASGFADHRKLKVHADEYVDKRTMTPDQLMGAIDALIGLGEPVAAADDNGFEIDEVEVDDLEMALDDLEQRPPDLASDEFGDESTAVAPPLAVLEAAVAGDPSDDEVAEEDVEGVEEVEELSITDLETAGGANIDLAEGSLDDDIALDSHTLEESEREPVTAVHSEQSGLVDDVLSSAPHAPAPEAVPVPAEEDGNADMSDDLDLGLEAVADIAAEESQAHAASNADEVARLRAEVDKLRTQLSQKPAAAEGSFSREREFLNLREVINRKEKEILDLQQRLDEKERAILEGRERIHELERSRADVEDKLLGLEQSLLAANEARSGLSDKVDQLTSSAAALESELESRTKELQASRTELENQRQLAEERAQAAASELRATVESHEQAMAAASRAHSEEMTDLEQRHSQELLKTKSELEAARNAALDALRDELDENHAQAMQIAKEAADAALVEADQRRHNELATAEEAHGQALAALEEDKTRSLQALEDQHAGQLVRLAREAEMAREEMTAQNAAALEEARAEHERNLQEQLAAAENRRQADLAAAAEERSLAENALQEKHEANRAALEQEHAEALATLDGEKDQLNATLAATREQVAQLESELAASRATTAARDTEIESLKTTIARNEDQIGNLHKEVSDLEGQNTDYQEQVLRAFQKIKTDEATMQRAKRALAVALTVLDEASDPAEGETGADSAMTSPGGGASKDSAEVTPHRS